ncbi:uncharacterized protein LOC114333387 [Diabrotica virgifera virgifera]|uniref:Uncharacterized protein LOC114333387 n=1 Tax=Diabrotica virgifera virgifera TaxID=50390 RepID=A0A6P7FRY9_DIAVI|nr:uncharacterized protein LOC114333387 [Diabrotica virgifera virgifera]
MSRKSDFRGFKLPTKMFDIDPETGKKILLPLQFENSDTKQGIPVTKSSPAKLVPIDFNKLREEIEAEERQSKKRKIDAPHSAKRLFTSTFQPRETLANKRKSKQLVIPRKSKVFQNQNPSSPLLNMEEVEEEILTNKKSLNKVPFKPVLKQITEEFHATRGGHKIKKPEIRIPEFKIDKSENIPEHINPSDECERGLMEDELKSPDSSREFNKLELMCVDSPITNMCNLMQDTVINSIKKTKLNNNSPNKSNLVTCINNIQDMMRKEEIRHQETMTQLNNVLLTLKSLVPDENFKENQNSTANRRSERLLKKSPPKNKKLLTSPAILRSDDLRKSTLKKNMAAKNPDCEKSPRSQKALALYNTIRSNSFVLETPRSDRKGSNLSHKIQTQCLLLQDTPVHHK